MLALNPPTASSSRRTFGRFAIRMPPDDLPGLPGSYRTEWGFRFEGSRSFVLQPAISPPGPPKRPSHGSGLVEALTEHLWTRAALVSNKLLLCFESVHLSLICSTRRTAEE